MKAIKTYLALCGVCVLLLTACNDRVLTQYQVDKSFVQPAIKPIDVLIVVDNSVSMEAENPKLQAAANQLVQTLIDSGADLQIGVVTMNIEQQLTSGVANQSGLLQAPSGTPTIQTTNGMDGATIISNFQNVLDHVQFNQNVGTDSGASPQSNVNGKGCEEGLEAARLAVDPDLNQNPGFVRPDAHLAIFFMTDEDDATVNANTSSDINLNDDCPAANSSERVFPKSFSTIGQYLNFFDELKGIDYSIHGFVTLPDGANPCTSPLEISTSFVEAIDTTRGFKASICSPDFTTLADDLGLSIASLANKFIVTIPVDPATLEVLQDGNLVSSSDYEIIDNGRAILFTTRPPVGARIQIRFFSQTNGLVLVN